MIKVAVVGAGGLVGKCVMKVLRETPIQEIQLHLTGHSESVGTQIEYMGQFLKIKKTDPQTLKKADIVVLCTPSQVSAGLVSLLRGGPIIVDTSSAFRMDDDVPLVVPEVNGHDIDFHKGLIAGPNCSTIQLVMSLYPIEKHFGLSRVHVSTYQSVSGAGRAAMDELKNRSLSHLARGSCLDDGDSVFPHPIEFNLIPQIDEFGANGYTKEELKMVNETRKIMNLPDLSISCTCVRVPVFIGHSEACLVETKRPPCINTIRDELSRFPGVVIMDDILNRVYPTPLHCQDTDEVYIGRLRRDLSSDNGILYWLVADNLRRGAATNACNIVRAIVGEGR